MLDRNLSKLGNSDITSFEAGFDTGKAALLAYTNLDQLVVADDLASEGWRKSPNTRNNFISQKSADISSTMISHGVNIESVVPSISNAILAHNNLTGTDSTSRSDLKDSLRHVQKYSKPHKNLMV